MLIEIPAMLHPRRNAAPLFVAFSMLLAGAYSMLRAEPDAGELVHDFSGSLVFIEGGGGAGSGFICKWTDGIFITTNQHVLAAMPTVKITRLDLARVPAGAVQAAVGHDIMRLATTDVPNPLVASENVESDARIGDDVIVLGNSEGARVIQPLAGKLLGIGPDRIEVSAEFVPGNSGSPIIHVKSGKVIGIATYLKTREFPEFSDRRESRVRRFGYRLDSVKQWQPVTWNVYQSEKAEADRVEATTKDLMRLIRVMRDDARMNAGEFSNPAVNRTVRDFLQGTEKQKLSAVDRTRATQNFLASIRSATMSDITQARQRLRYDFFRQSVEEQAEIREQMFQLFDRLLKSKQ
ncbi:MAG TPA: serine protease [Chthoniobacteraceae bacterium]|nr:serine protease [Chthoniobacteraceae bacterium]